VCTYWLAFNFQHPFNQTYFHYRYLLLPSVSVLVVHVSGPTVLLGKYTSFCSPLAAITWTSDLFVGLFGVEPLCFPQSVPGTRYWLNVTKSLQSPVQVFCYTDGVQLSLLYIDVLYDENHRIQNFVLGFWWCNVSLLLRVKLQWY
jgi:hypothetical protein